MRHFPVSSSATHLLLAWVLHVEHGPAVEHQHRRLAHNHLKLEVGKGQRDAHVPDRPTPRLGAGLWALPGRLLLLQAGLQDVWHLVPCHHIILVDLINKQADHRARIRPEREVELRASCCVADDCAERRALHLDAAGINRVGADCAPVALAEVVGVAFLLVEGVGWGCAAAGQQLQPDHGGVVVGRGTESL